MSVSGSLKECVRSVIFEQILAAVTPASGWKVLAVDHAAMRMLSACCSLPEIIDQGVTIVDNVALARPPFPDQDAIYLLAPTLENAAYIRKDFLPKKKYACCHIFFTDVTPDEVVKALAPLQKGTLASRALSCLVLSCLA